jgi:hypothetical protein
MTDEEPVLKRRYAETLADYEARKWAIAEAKRKSRSTGYGPVSNPANKRIGVEEQK